MFEHMLAMVMGEHLAGAGFSPRIDAPGYKRILARERRPFQTLDGHICTLIYNDREWLAFARLIGRPDLLDTDPRFANVDARSRNYAASNTFLAGEFRKRSTAQWLADLEQADIPAQRLNDLEDIIADPHLAAIGYFVEREHPTEGRILSMAVPSEWSESPPGYRHHAPQLGQHTRELLREAGMTEAAIEAMLHSGAARAAES